MKNEIEIPVIREENLVAANMRREKYSITRDVQAREFNEAIVARLLSESVMKIKCETCGREFSVPKTEDTITKCPDCR
jgi:hypothetical protein